MRSIAIGAALVFLVSGCGTSDAGFEGVERTDSSGVEIVINAQGDVPLDWPIREMFRLGGADSGPEAFYRVREEGVAADAAGNLYILDAGNFRVLKFDPQGQHAATFGREGGGPGEFEFPAMLAVSPRGEILVQDYGKAGLVKFSPDGEPLDASPWEEPLAISAFHAAPSGLIVARREYRRDNDQDTIRVSLLTASDTVDFAFSPRPSSGEMMRLESCGIAFSGMGPLLSAELQLGGYGDRLALNKQPEYVIDIYDGASRVASYRRGIPNEATTRERAIAELGEGMRVGLGGGGEERVCDSEEVVEKRGYADVVPHVAGVAVAPDGSVWVQRKGIAQEDAPIDILDPSGAYVGTLPPGTPFPDAFLPNGNLVSVERDELDIEYVAVYELDGGRF